MTENEAKKKSRDNQILIGQRWTHKRTLVTVMIIDVQPQYIKLINDWVVFIYFEPSIVGGIAKAVGVSTDELFRDYSKLNG